MTGALMNVIAVDRDDVPEFDDWYSREHFPERLAVTGFRNARRFVEDPDRGAARVEYFSIYETDSVEVLTSPEYLAALDSPTPRTKNAVALFRQNERTVGTRRFRGGLGRTGRILLGRITGGVGMNGSLVEAVEDIARATIESGLAEGVAVYETDAVAASAKDSTAEGKAAGSAAAADERPSVFVVIEQYGSLAVSPTGSVSAAVDRIGAHARWSTYRLVSDQSSQS
ncbi:hypothetical protein CH296_07085 [Rhodococcus sp. 14-2496-1d]|uniref:DUF4286 family protein n=1 Tax=unclassified Rhodococcus (in: high G+C Gram-positive bacteria) TaxID=192944 RepID=UPI000B9A47F9|nr:MULTISPECIES: DUF4286 family protein [unclassified Rhodococcus (in: high G+C Gram-positive bacteria)]OZE02564.1 hypothetical protein CH250_25355 [Rhodococcus sp. 05-2255-3C]OZE11369.1 hypothetical protein CH249_11405 [Rhodococcus sp. 05-2255-3B1]OZE13095.1 hypothetical protein CH255_24825 [Rhodococcus sp. 05-2255-2A2]OZF36053.1 hypothetical protein CH296_07085 [Rhodococcus sp. 14-2496-1d]